MNVSKTRADLTIRIIEEVADRKDVDPMELTPLYEVLDPDALDMLLTTPRFAGSRSLTVQFTYEGYSVTVQEDGHVEISPA